MLVLRSDFDPRWILSDGNARPTPSRLVDGFANGWAIAPGSRHFILRFSPAGYLRAALAVGLFWLILLFVDVVRMLREARYRSGAH
ncbi:MAG: hypothetical protein JO233_05570 [Candidatus Eremiobacteraeota bacterium]|nr:hypothetical protein [Candidatus Eremiobacteraeota bacterium]